MSELRIRKDETAVVVIDIQANILPAMDEAEAIEEKSAKLIEGARELNTPIIITEQYPKGLGYTTEKIANALGDYKAIEKRTFSAVPAEGFMDALEETGAKSVVIIGIETHVCVLMTAIDLIEAGYNVFLAADCVSSRKPYDKKMALKRLGKSGVKITTMESVLFELLDDSRAAEFKAISKIVK